MAQGLDDHKVRQAKRLLLQGVSAVRIARLLDCSVETIRRYKRGESRAGVVVEGEENLRPPLDLEELSDQVQGKTMSEAEAEAVDESLARLMAGLNGVSEGGVK